MYVLSFGLIVSFLTSVLGIAAAFYSVVRAMRQLNAEQDKEGK